MTAAFAQLAFRRSAVAAARAGMFAAFVDRLNRSGVPYCLLSGYQGFLDVGDGDVDFMVRPRDFGRVPAVLAEAARHSDALLVQAIRHETGACYFVLAKQVGDEVAYLHPDCTTNYRRDGRLWLRAEEVLSRRQEHGSFFVAADADEFVYYLVKKVLKREVNAVHLRRLRALYVAAPGECCERVRRFWRAASVNATVSATLGGDVEGMRWLLPALREELLASERVEVWPSRAVQGVREAWRWAERVLHPTGMSVVVCGRNRREPDTFAEGMETTLRAAFRRTVVTDGSGLSSAIWDWLERVRSTLVIRGLAASAAPRIGRNQICFDLNETTEVEHATNAALRWLARRLQSRMGYAANEAKFDQLKNGRK